MSDPYVREVGTVAAMDGRKVRVGVDYDSVTIDGKPLSQDAADDLAQLYVSACWQAGQNARRAAEEVHEADGGDSMAYCGQVDGIYECTETGPHTVHLARDIYSKIVHAWDAEASDG